MQRLIAILSMLVDCLRLFMVIELQISSDRINIIIFTKHNNVRDYEIFPWKNEKENADAIKLAIHWLLQYAISVINEGSSNEENEKDLLSKLSP